MKHVDDVAIKAEIDAISQKIDTIIKKVECLEASLTEKQEIEKDE